VAQSGPRPATATRAAAEQFAGSKAPSSTAAHIRTIEDRVADRELRAAGSPPGLSDRPSIIPVMRGTDGAVGRLVLPAGPGAGPAIRDPGAAESIRAELEE
jgi:hypothetical protein